MHPSCEKSELQPVVDAYRRMIEQEYGYWLVIDDLPGSVRLGGELHYNVPVPLGYSSKVEKN
jgi:hypothetical protein